MTVSDNYGYDRDVPTPTVPPVDQESFTANVPTDEWVNYWDVNPIRHGATFVTYDEQTGMWDIVEVTPPSAWNKTEYLVSEHAVYPSDVWSDPTDPQTAWSDDMQDILASLGDDDMPPNAPPSLEKVTYWVADFPHLMYGRSDAIEVKADEPTPATYWSKIVPDRVNPSDVRGVSDESLPE